MEKSNVQAILVAFSGYAVHDQGTMGGNQFPIDKPVPPIVKSAQNILLI